MTINQVKHLPFIQSIKIAGCFLVSISSVLSISHLFHNKRYLFDCELYLHLLLMMESVKKLSPSQFKEEQKWNYVTNFISHDAKKMSKMESWM